MKSIYKSIKSILGEATPPKQYSESELQAMRDKRAAELKAKSGKTTSSNKVTRVSEKLPGSTVDNNGNKQPALVIPKSLESDIAKSEKSLKANKQTIPNIPANALKNQEAMKKDTNAKPQAATTGSEKTGPDLNDMKKSIAKPAEPVKSADTKPDADKVRDLAGTSRFSATRVRPEEQPSHDYKTGETSTRSSSDSSNSGERSAKMTAPAPEIDSVKTTNNVAKAAEPVEINRHLAPPIDVEKEKAAEPKTQAAAEAPKSSSEFKFSPEQEKWLGKANRQDPYILNRMPGEKPPVDYYKDTKDQELAKKINIGNETAKKIKGVFGMKESINKKFNVSDALYQSVMEVMKKDKKEGSIPRNDKEKELAAAYGDPKRITHGDVLKMRGVTKEEVEPVEEGIMDKVLPILTGGSDKDLLKKLQKDMGVPQTGQKPAPTPAKPVKENKDTPGNGYAHQCAVHVKSESFGEGRTITTQHADPDAEGNIAWYDVMFEHGIEKQVPTSTLEILVSENHMHMKKKKAM